MAEIELRLFRYFMALAEELHFARAAERLGISPPTLTVQIQGLEARLDVRLCRRSTKSRVELTEAGKRFRDQARNVLRQAEEAEFVARQAARGEIGSIEIGYMMSVSCSGLIQKFVGGFQRTNPGIEINLHRLGAMAQVRAIVEGKLDIGFARPPSDYPPELSGINVFTQPLVVALPGGHRLAAKRRIAPSELKDEAFITTTLEVGFGFGEFTEAVTKIAGFSPRVARRASDIYNVLTYVSAGFGIGVMGKSISRLAIPNVVFRDLALSAPPQSPVACLHRRNETAPAAMAFIQAISRHRLKA
jgi:DNA-binding transcriptional LysR family regulator